MKKKFIVTITLIIILIVIILGVILLVKLKDSDKSDEKLSDAQYYILDGNIYEKTEGINESAITNNIDKINNIYENYLSNMNVYFAMIPNKEYYLNNSEDQNSEFECIEEFTANKLNGNIRNIELYDTLNLDSFYKTDMHWKQESLDKTVERIALNMNVEGIEKNYESKSLGDFYGSYYKQINDSTIKPDELIYLTNSAIENSIVYNVEKEREEPVYNEEVVNETRNKYDLFLSGAVAVQQIKNTEANNGKKLILFRDSFGSSIAPLLIGDYEEILLVDIRYVNSNLLSNYIDFNEYKNQDALFLYNARVINKSGIFR